MTCPKCGAEMDWHLPGEYPLGHWECPDCGFKVSKK